MAWNNVPLNGWPQLRGMENLSEALTVLDDVTALKLAVGNEDNGLIKDVDDLQTTVGDNTAGLVKDVDDLQTTVGDNTAGLVKTVNDMASYSTTETVVGKWGTDVLYRKIVDIGTVEGGGSARISSGLSNVTIRNITICQNDTSAFRVFPWTGVVSDITVLGYGSYYDYSENKIIVSNVAGTSKTGFYAILEYTKNPLTRDDDTEEVAEPETKTTKRSTKKNNGGE